MGYFQLLKLKKMTGEDSKNRYKCDRPRITNKIIITLVSSVCHLFAMPQKSTNTSTKF
jgi:hypothetical protein